MKRRATALALALLLAAPASTGCRGGSRPLPEEPNERQAAILARAWGPESPDTLEKYLEARGALAELYERQRDALQNWALREAATAMSLTGAVIGVSSMRRKAEQEMQRRGLNFDDFQRLTALVYIRWLRASRPGDPPEKPLVRALREIEVGISRQIDLVSGDPSADVERLERRLTSIRQQAGYLEPIAMMDKTATLERIDPSTRQWLEAHREQIEKLDWIYFDTAPPPIPAAERGR